MGENSKEYYRQKYLKYKAKYLDLETQVAGGLFDVLKSMNGYYFIFHKNIDKTQIEHTDDKKQTKKMDDKIQKMIPDEKPTSISIGLTDIPMFMRNEHQIDTLFEDAIIVRLYLNKDKYMFDICEYIYYGSKKRTLTINATEIIKQDVDDRYFNNIDVFVKSLNLQDLRVKNTLNLLMQQSFIKLTEYYKKKQNIDGITQTLIEAKKVNFLDKYTIMTELNHVFIVSDIKKQSIPPRVLMNIKNIKIF